MKNITFSAPENLIKKARERAAREKVSLNDRFREWLKLYANTNDFEKDFKEMKKRLSYVKAGRKFTREEMNER